VRDYRSDRALVPFTHTLAKMMKNKLQILLLFSATLFSCNNQPNNLTPSYNNDGNQIINQFWYEYSKENIRKHIRIDEKITDQDSCRKIELSIYSTSKSHKIENAYYNIDIKLPIEIDTAAKRIKDYHKLLKFVNDTVFVTYRTKNVDSSHFGGLGFLLTDEKLNYHYIDSSFTSKFK
jgi:hypothetical protein